VERIKKKREEFIIHVTQVLNLKAILLISLNRVTQNGPTHSPDPLPYPPVYLVIDYIK
jgi:hypothetical protein